MYTHINGLFLTNDLFLATYSKDNGSIGCQDMKDADNQELADTSSEQKPPFCYLAVVVVSAQ